MSHGVCKRDEIKFYICNRLRNRNETKLKILYTDSACRAASFGNDEGGKYLLYNRRSGSGRMFYFTSRSCKPEHSGADSILLYHLPCRMGHADISHVPTDKSFIRPETVFHKYRMRNNPLSDHSIYSHTYNPSDPLTYYVYGLRKIII